jgi:CheY-like chemotaxis protein
LKRILLAEDSERDIELTLAALDEYHLANEVVVVRDGAEALDYLHQRGNHSSHPNGLPVVMVTSSREEQDLVRSYELGVNGYVVKPVDFQKFAESIKQIGYFWAIINEPPPGVARR